MSGARGKDISALALQSTDKKTDVKQNVCDSIKTETPPCCGKQLLLAQSTDSLVVTPEDDEPSAPTNNRRRASQETVLTFPETVHKMVSETSRESPDVIDWIEDGEAFVVKDPKSKELGKVLQKFFRHKKYSSLQRQLNMYGWRKFVNGKYKGAFHHEKFHRDRSSSLELNQITRRTRKQGPPVTYSGGPSKRTSQTSETCRKKRRYSDEAYHPGATNQTERVAQSKPRRPLKKRSSHPNIEIEQRPSTSNHSVQRHVLRGAASSRGKVLVSPFPNVAQPQCMGTASPMRTLIDGTSLDENTDAWSPLIKGKLNDIENPYTSYGALPPQPQRASRSVRWTLYDGRMSHVAAESFVQERTGGSPDLYIHPAQALPPIHSSVTNPAPPLLRGVSSSIVMPAPLLRTMSSSAFAPMPLLRAASSTYSIGMANMLSVALAPSPPVRMTQRDNDVRGHCLSSKSGFSLP